MSRNLAVSLGRVVLALLMVFLFVNAVVVAAAGDVDQSRINLELVTLAFGAIVFLGLVE